MSENHPHEWNLDEGFDDDDQRDQHLCPVLEHVHEHTCDQGCEWASDESADRGQSDELIVLVRPDFEVFLVVEVDHRCLDQS